MNIGATLVLLFVIAGAFRDVFFGSVFQRYPFFEVVLVSFSLATIIFLLLVSLRAPQQFGAIVRVWKEAVLANVGTASAWLSYFFSLKLLEPSAVSTIHAGMGSITLVAISAMGWHISRPVAVRRLEYVLHGGLLLTLLALAGVVLAGLSGLPGRSLGQNLLGLFFAFASGIFISLTSDVTKRMHEKGVTAEGVLAVRFVGMIAVAATATFVIAGDGPALAEGGALAEVAGAALLLIVAPLYLLQLGIVRTSAVTTWVIMAIGPVLVFAAQFLDGRLVTSPYTLACILAYSAMALLCNFARLRTTRRAASEAAAQASAAAAAALRKPA